MRTRRGLAKTLTALATGLSVFGALDAHAVDPCDEAARLVGDSAKTMSPEGCQQVVDAAEEERWQLWLDMALAHEHAGDDLAAVEYYGRFIEAVDARKRSPSSSWLKARSDAKAAVKRLDADLRATLGRVDVRSTPSDAAASFEGKAMETARLVTPFTTYLAPGEHTLELYHPDFSKPVQKTFTLEKGQVLALDLDIAGELAPRKGPPAETIAKMPAPDRTPPPHEPVDVLETVGWIGVAAGIGLAATGAVLVVDGQGQIDDADCATEPWCAPTADERARRQDAGEATRTGGVIALVAGGVLIAGGVVAIVLSDDGDTPRSGARLEAITPTVMRDGSPGVGAAFSF